VLTIFHTPAVDATRWGTHTALFFHCGSFMSSLFEKALSQGRDPSTNVSVGAAGAVIEPAGDPDEVIAVEPIHIEKSDYCDIAVYQEGDLRSIRFGHRTSSRVSCMSLSNRRALILDYTRMMMTALYLNRSPRRVLIVGLGGGTLPRALRHLLATTRIDVVEIDPAMVRVAKQFFDFEEDGRLHVAGEDARAYIKRARARGLRYDLVMLDACGQEYIPEHLMTREFLLEVRDVLSDRGVLVANTFATSKLYDRESVTYNNVFGRFYQLELDNRIIVLRLGGLPDGAELAHNAALLDSQLAPIGVARALWLPMFEIAHSWPAHTEILVDPHTALARSCSANRGD